MLLFYLDFILKTKHEIVNKNSQAWYYWVIDIQSSAKKRHSLAEGYVNYNFVIN